MSIRSRDPALPVRSPAAAPLLDWSDVRDAAGHDRRVHDLDSQHPSTQRLDTQHHDTQHHNTQHHNTQHSGAHQRGALDRAADPTALAATAGAPADLDALWAAALRRLRQQAPRSVVSTWLSPLQLLRLSEGEVWLAAADAPTAELVRVHYLDLVESALTAEAGTDLRVRLGVAPHLRGGDGRGSDGRGGDARGSDGRGSDGRGRAAADAAEVSDAADRRAGDAMPPLRHDLPLVSAPETAEPSGWRDAAVGREAQGAPVLWPSQDGGWPGSAPSLQSALLTSPGAAPRDEADLLSARLTFSSFVVGSSNELAASAARAVALVPGQQYNPLFLHGGVGLGKTHLLHAIGHLARERHPNLRVRYVAAETYIDDNLSAWRSKDGGARNDVRNLYRRDVDLLLVDDIQFLEGRDRVQEEFFHLFNALHQAGKQIVLTGDRFPAELTQLHDRLRSRFEWGLVAEINPPDRDLRLSILRQNAQRLGMALPHDVAIYLADHLRNNVRELEGALTKLLAHARIGKRTVDLQLARSVLGPLLELPARNLSVEVIQRVTAQQFGLKVTDLKGERRHRSVVVPRMVAMFLTRKHTQLSFPEIGRAFGGRDHSTVIHACQKVEWLLATDAETQATAQAIESALGK